MSSPSASGHWLDKVYLVYFIIHIPILFCVDLVPLYPSKLWAEAGAPLQCLADLRAWYLATYGDQFFAPSPPAQIPSFFPLFALLELLFHLPVSLWAVRRLAGGKAAGGGKGGVKGKGAALRGKDELLLLVYGIETALTTATCMYEAYLWDPALVSARQKVVLLGGLYGGYLALAVVLTIDMYGRLLRRLGAADAAVKKTQ